MLLGPYPPEREVKVLEYIIHRLGDGARLEDIVQEEVGHRYSLGLAHHGGRALDDLEGELAILNAYDYPVARFERAVKDHPRKLVFYPALDGTPQGPGPKLRVKALLGHKLYRLFGELHLHVLGTQAALGPLQE